jgi:hypothetical protein
MSVGPGHVEPPTHPLPAQTTSELSDHRRQLEIALTAASEQAGVRALLQDRLAEVLAEQDSRARLHAAGHR